MFNSITRPNQPYSNPVGMKRNPEIPERKPSIKCNIHTRIKTTIEILEREQITTIESQNRM